MVCLFFFVVIACRCVHWREHWHGHVVGASADADHHATPLAEHPPRPPLRRRPSDAGGAVQHRHPRHRVGAERAAAGHRQLQRDGGQLGGAQRGRALPRREHHGHRGGLRGAVGAAQRGAAADARHALPPERAGGRGAGPVHQDLDAALVVHHPRLVPAVAGLLQPVAGQRAGADAQVPAVHGVASHAQRVPVLRLHALQRRDPAGLRAVPAAAAQQGGRGRQHLAALHQRVRRGGGRRLLRHGVPQRYQRSGDGDGDRVAAQGRPVLGARRHLRQRRHLQQQPHPARDEQHRHAQAPRGGRADLHLRAVRRGHPAWLHVGEVLGPLRHERRPGLHPAPDGLRRPAGQRHDEPDLLRGARRRGPQDAAGGAGLGVRPREGGLLRADAGPALLRPGHRGGARHVRLQRLLPRHGYGLGDLLLQRRRGGDHDRPK